MIISRLNLKFNICENMFTHVKVLVVHALIALLTHVTFDFTYYVKLFSRIDHICELCERIFTHVNCMCEL